MERRKGYVCWARLRCGGSWFYGKPVTNPRLKYDSFEHTLTTFETLKETKEVIKQIKTDYPTHYESIIPCKLNMLIAETPDENKRLERRKSLIVIVKTSESSNEFKGPCTDDADEDGLFTEKGIETFSSFAKACKVARRIRRNFGFPVKLSSFRLKPVGHLQSAP